MLTKIDKTVIFITIITAIISMIPAISISNSSESSLIIVYKSGRKQATYDLSRNREVSFKDKQSQKCTLKIVDGTAYIKKSTCPLKICMKRGRIKKAGQAIICAPMGLLIKIESNVQTLDAVNE